MGVDEPGDDRAGGRINDLGVGYGWDLADSLDEPIANEDVSRD